jgi:hypothetical protein
MRYWSGALSWEGFGVGRLASRVLLHHFLIFN